MGTRLELQTFLEDLMAAGGSTPHVYFQPPETVKMVYPCIVYTLDRVDMRYANNHPYKHKKGYTVTVIDRNPDSTIPDQVLMLPETSFTRKFVNDNLHHFVIRMYF